MAVLTNYAGSRDDYSNFGTSTTYSQSFQLTTASQVTAVQFNGSRGAGSSGTFKMELKSGSPTGTVLATTGTLNSTVLPAYNAGGVDSLNSFTLVTPVLLAISTTYFLVVTPLTGSAADELRWNLDNTSPSYTTGNFYTASTSVPGTDTLFSIDGNPGPLTSPVTNIALTTATGNAEIFTDGGSTITERGVCWATSTVPTTANFKQSTTGTIGVYSVSMTGLAINTLYYVRAYYINGLGTTYGTEVSFTTQNIAQYELRKDIGATNGQTFIGQITVTGTLGTITVQLGTTGTSTVINAGAGATAFTGTYSGLSGIIITRSVTFNGTVDNIYYSQVALGTTINWALDSVVIVSAIDSSVFFKRIEDDVFNSFRFYRYLDLLFKDLDGYVTVTVRDEREDITTEREKTFTVGNISTGTVSPFQKKRVSFLIKNQAVIIGLSNANVSETFSIAKFLLTGHKKTQRNFSPSKIQSLS